MWLLPASCRYWTIRFVLVGEETWATKPLIVLRVMFVTLPGTSTIWMSPPELSNW
jgi:hypothetical protein